MRYANVIIFIRERLWQKAINFSSASWHFNIPVCITCFSQMIIFCVFHLRWQSIIFFSIASCYFSKLSLSEERNVLWLKFHSGKKKKKIVSEIQVVYLMGKIIARQMKQSMTHSNQREWLKTQVSREVRLFTPTFAAIIHMCSFTHLVTLHPDWSDVFSLTRWASSPPLQPLQKLRSILIKHSLNVAISAGKHTLCQVSGTWLLSTLKKVSLFDKSGERKSSLLILGS